MRELIIKKVTKVDNSEIKFLIDDSIVSVEDTLRDIVSDFKLTKKGLDLINKNLKIDLNYILTEIPQEIFERHKMYPCKTKMTLSIVVDGSKEFN